MHDGKEEGEYLWCCEHRNNLAFKEKKANCFYKMYSRNPYFLYEPENKAIIVDT